jgi:hypothetical protein
MKFLALIIAVYTMPMLLIHLSTAKILKAWSEVAGSWIKRHFPPRRALRVEALYWLLSLAAWPIWRAAGWKALVAVFAGIHLGIWLAGELGKIQLSSDPKGSPADSRRLNTVVIAFDLIEATVLVVVGTLAVLYLLHAVGGFTA